jgi:UDP-N-acetylmuramate dehydrogenase
MMAHQERPGLIERLPKVRGRLASQVSLAPLTWFRVGGPAEVLFRPADEADLSAFLTAAPEDVPITVIGASSNLLVRDGGIEGVVVRLGKGFADIDVADGIVTVGAGALDLTVAKSAAEAGLGGLEFLSGIPGTIGGALRMNAGAYGAELKDVLVDAIALDSVGRRLEVKPGDLALAYRSCGAPEDWIFTAARLRGVPAAQADIAARMAAIRSQREAAQPVRSRTGGSTFANPKEAKAWELIDRAGCRGMKRGGAKVSELHANFLINTGNATAGDLEGLGEEVRRRVFDTSGIVLDWEIKRIGRAIPHLSEVPS